MSVSGVTYNFDIIEVCLMQRLKIFSSMQKRPLHLRPAFWRMQVSLFGMRYIHIFNQYPPKWLFNTRKSLRMSFPYLSLSLFLCEPCPPAHNLLEDEGTGRWSSICKELQVLKILPSKNIYLPLYTAPFTWFSVLDRGQTGGFAIRPSSYSQ